MAATLGAGLQARTALAEEGDRPSLSVFRDCPECPEMVVVPAGRFVMGDGDGAASERPPRTIVFERPFALARTETTFEQWQACRDAGGCAADPHDRDWGRGDRPVINVTLADARAYAAWLSAHTGHPYRLPSEAEWEYAARAGTQGNFWWGNDAGEGMANCRTCGSPWGGLKTAPAGSFPPNPWGFYDMPGNVWEWVDDCWRDTLAEHPDDGRALPSSADPGCTHGVTRGGAWYYIDTQARLSNRARTDVRIWSYTIGFRVLRELP